MILPIACSISWTEAAGWVLGALALALIFLRVWLRGEIRAALERDPAASSAWEVLLLYPSVFAIGCHRVAHPLHLLGFKFIARAISQTSRGITGIEIHPGAKIGRGLFIDHGMGVVIGETTVIGDNVTLFQGVTLGGTGKEKGKRHPTIGNNVVVGTGAKVLGSFTVGDNVQIGANAVVIKEVPPHSVVVGVPGRIVRQHGKEVSEEITLDHSSLPDPLAQALEKLQREINAIEEQFRTHRKKSNS